MVIDYKVMKITNNIICLIMAYLITVIKHDLDMLIDNTIIYFDLNY